MGLLCSSPNKHIARKTQEGALRAQTATDPVFKMFAMNKFQLHSTVSIVIFPCIEPIDHFPLLMKTQMCLEWIC